ncbi:hypothetical protein Shyd_15730 [Streptomyces hydrogenans]|uniref:Uncharacterized protein n=1 Tax=Streptomyces hydrogenans TaxID=1873719 RepID=A0ABQ3P5A8_9ACTN|nr:hypothetical protein GCM10018784_75590 [Streptomyces hydrogenans]GHI20202.1 hypothetical protein Shyd_15730 [Streptomyces hydrogenans]
MAGPARRTPPAPAGYHPYILLLPPGPLSGRSLKQPTEAELRSLAVGFDLHELAVEDALEAHQRPKPERYGDTLLGPPGREGCRDRLVPEPVPARDALALDLALRSRAVPGEEGGVAPARHALAPERASVREKISSGSATLPERRSFTSSR